MQALHFIPGRKKRCQQKFHFHPVPNRIIISTFVEKNGDCIGSLRYEYRIADHLGNTRAVYTDTDKDGEAELLQEEAYYPFGMRIPSMSKSYSGCSDDRYLYNGKELEGRIEGFHFYDYGARFYDAALGRFHTQDRFAEKYTGLTPYHYCGGNPIRYIDVNGDSLDIKNNQQSEIDIKSIVEGNEQSRLIFTGTGSTLSVTINYGKMSVADKATLLENNPGLKLIDDLVNACEKYLYEATEAAKVLDEKGSRKIHTLYDDDNGVLNASAVGKDSDGKYTFLPADGYQGQVSIAETGTWATTSGSVMKRENMVFHELAESYERTSSGHDYNKAHSLAFRRERQSTWSLKTRYPGNIGSFKTGLTNPNRSTFQSINVQYQKNGY